MADNDNNEVDVINFYRAGDAYGCFSNFSRHAVWLKDKRWPTSEHYFQAQKFPDTKFEELIRNARDPGDSARLGRDRSKPLRKDWEEVKDEIMRQVVYAKFTQHKDLREILLSTKNALLVEHTVNDSYWGDGGDGSGKNMLGKTLMIVREQIRQELENPSKPLVQSTPKESETIVKENERITKENSDSNESGESDEEDEIEPNTNNERYVGGLRIISTPSSMDPKKAMAKKRKARRKRNVFVDNSGTSHVERNNEHKGQVNLVGGDKSILFSEKALPPSAKLVLHKHQYQRRFEPDEAELDREEDEEPVGRTRGPKAKNTLSLGDYFPAQNQQQQQEKSNEMPEEYLTVEGCIKAATATLEVLKDLPKTDNQVDELLEQCKLLKGLTLEFIQQEQPEDVTVQLLNTIECLNEVIKE